MPTLEEWIADRLVEAVNMPEILAHEEWAELQPAYPVRRGDDFVDVMRSALTMKERADISAFFEYAAVEAIETLCDILRHQSAFDTETERLTKTQGG